MAMQVVLVATGVAQKRTACSKVETQLVQTVTPLADGSGVATTIARYETPNHVDINKKGIEVDADAGGAMCPDPYPNL